MRFGWVVEQFFVTVVWSINAWSAPQSAAQESEADFLRPTLVTVQGQMSLTEAVHEIGQQAGIRISASEFSNRVRPFDIRDLDFWTCLDKIMSENGAQLFPIAFADHDLAVIPAPPEFDQSQQYIVRSGPFRVQLFSMESLRTFLPTDEHRLRIGLAILWEPHARPVAIKLPLDQWTAVADDGTIIEPAHPTATADATVDESSFYVLNNIRFHLPPRNAARIQTLKGPIQIIIPGKARPFEFANLVDRDQVRELKNGDATVRLDGWSRQDDFFELRLHVSYTEAYGALESFQSWITQNEVALDDGMGTTYKPENLQVTSSPNGVHLVYQFKQNPESLNLVYHTAHQIHFVVIEAEFKDLILP